MWNKQFLFSDVESLAHEQMLVEVRDKKRTKKGVSDESDRRFKLIGELSWFSFVLLVCVCGGGRDSGDHGVVIG